MLLKIKLATSGFVSETTDVDFLNTYFDVDPSEEEEESEQDSGNDEEDEEDNPDDGNEIHRIDEESRRLDEIYFGIR